MTSPLDWSACERRVATALGLALVAPGTRGYDALDEQGRRYQIKCRRLTLRHGTTPHLYRRVQQLTDPSNFDYLIVALLDEATAEVQQAFRMTSEAVARHGRPKANGGWWLRMTSAVRADPDTDDVTKTFL